MSLAVHRWRLKSSAMLPRDASGPSSATDPRPQRRYHSRHLFLPRSRRPTAALEVAAAAAALLRVGGELRHQLAAGTNTDVARRRPWRHRRVALSLLGNFRHLKLRNELCWRSNAKLPRAVTWRLASRYRAYQRTTFSPERETVTVVFVAVDW